MTPSKASTSSADWGKGFTVWFTGLPCSGKSTVAKALYRELRKEMPVLLLDGDVVREGLCGDLRFSRADRGENLRRLREVAALVNAEGISAIAANITPYEEDRSLVQLFLDHVLLVWMDTPAEVCEERDVKGMWASARAGKIKNFTGVGDPFEEPKTPDVRLTPDDPVNDGVGKILEALRRKGWF